MIDVVAIKLRYEALSPVLDERGRRRFAAAEALTAGWGGIAAVSAATGIARSTIGYGLRELRGDAPNSAVGGVRRKGAGRKPLTQTDPTLLSDLERLVDPQTRGDPGIDHDTAAFAVNAIRSWWMAMGRSRYLTAHTLTITADGGGSNGSRVRLWKLELQKLADELGLTIVVLHLPPGTSKWNKIEHRLFSFISRNWRGRPLTDYRTIVELIGATTSTAGLTVRCQLDKNLYPAGIKVSNEEMAELNILRHEFHGEWNYTINPRRPKTAR